MGNLNPWGDMSDEDDVPFGLTDKNREIVRILFRYLHEQKFISKVPDLDPLFVEGAYELVDA